MRYIVDREIALDQFNVLVDRYSDTPFTFRLMGLEIIASNKFYRSLDDDVALGNQYRKGGWETLNCYFGAAFGEGSYAYFPQVRSLQNPTVSIIDGTYNDLTTMPGVDPDESACCRLGLTVVHEVGHWYVV